MATSTEPAASASDVALGHARRHRARETTQRLGHVSDEAEAFELQETPGGQPTVTAGFDPLTPGEHAWMGAALAAILLVTGTGLYLCWGQ